MGDHWLDRIPKLEDDGGFEKGSSGRASTYPFRNSDHLPHSNVQLQLQKMNKPISLRKWTEPPVPAFSEGFGIFSVHRRMKSHQVKTKGSLLQSQLLAEISMAEG